MSPTMTSRGLVLMALTAGTSAEELSANPIRKVVDLLQAMQAKMTKEGEKEKELYDKFMCYCSSGTSDLTRSISDNEAKVPQVTAELEASKEKLTQSKVALKTAQADRAAAKQALAEASALRNKEAEAFAARKTQAEACLAATNAAIAALEKGAAGSFLQSDASNVLRQMVTSSTVDMADADRQDLVAFLDQRSEYAPVSGEVLGMLKSIGTTMSKDLAEVTASEQAAVESYQALMAAKQKEIAALSATIEAKQTQVGELGVDVVRMKEELTDGETSLLEDNKFLDELEKCCKTRTAEWEERQQVRSDEFVALADTVKILNDDDALDLFKKTLPSSAASLAQISDTMSSQSNRALQIIRSMRQSDRRPALDLMTLALTGNRCKELGCFDKVITMVVDLVALLKQEQLDDDNKKEYCTTQLARAGGKRDALKNKKIPAVTDVIEDHTSTIVKLTEEIAKLQQGIKELDKSVADATDQRKAENAEYKELVASNTAAIELLGVAKNRLNKFYYKAQYKEQAVSTASFLQVSAQKEVCKATWGAYSKKTEEGGGVIAMIDVLVQDLETEIHEAEMAEREAQMAYEALMSDSADKRSQMAKSAAEKAAQKAELESKVEGDKGDKKERISELVAIEKYISQLQTECGWLLNNFDARKAARTDEVDSLLRAKAVLSGADYSLVQVRTHGNLRKTTV